MAKRPNILLKLIAVGLVIAIVVMLLRPAELTNEQLEQIKPGMTIEQVISIVGHPNAGANEQIRPMIRFIGSGLDATAEDNEKDYVGTWQQKGRMWNPTITASIPDWRIKIKTESQTSKWLGKSLLLWVEHNNGVVTKVGAAPDRRQPCLDLNWKSRSVSKKGTQSK